MQGKNIETTSSQIAIYQSKDGEVHLEVRILGDTIWLTQKQIADLFKTDRSVITKHLHNIFKNKELDENSVCAKIAHTARDGKIYETKFYSLDSVISVGYRVNSVRATQFRIWATQVLKSYLLKGYALNEKRLREQEARLRSLESAISLIQSKSGHSLLKDQAKELLSIIHEYAKALTLLGQYDEGKLKIQRTQDSKFILRYDDCIRFIHEVKSILMKKKEAGSIFGQETNAKFKGIIGALYQTFDRKDFYKSLEEKAAHLLYFIIKDHPFVDGNKRIGSILFIYLLDKNNYLLKENGEKKINDNALVALSLLIATSDAKEKDIMVNIVTNLIK